MFDRSISDISKREIIYLSSETHWSCRRQKFELYWFQSSTSRKPLLTHLQRILISFKTISLEKLILAERQFVCRFFRADENLTLCHRLISSSILGRRRTWLLKHLPSFLDKRLLRWSGVGLDDCVVVEVWWFLHSSQCEMNIRNCPLSFAWLGVVKEFENVSTSCT